jgi:hypothetical protein
MLFTRKHKRPPILVTIGSYNYANSDDMCHIFEYIFRCWVAMGLPCKKYAAKMPPKSKFTEISGIWQNKVSEKLTRRLYCRCTRIWHKMSSYYAPHQAAIKNFKSNCIFWSTLILFASIYCKKRIRTEKRECLFSICKLFVSFYTKWEISRRNVEGVTFIQMQIFLNLVYLGLE